MPKNTEQKHQKNRFLGKRKVAGKVRKLDKASRFWPKARMRPETKKQRKKRPGKRLLFKIRVLKKKKKIRRNPTWKT